MKYIVYLTTNLKNGKIYIGVHKTETPYKFDGYIGCGVYISKKNNNPTISKADTPFRKAINKYGASSFVRSLISVFDNAEDAYNLEEILVDKTFIKSKHTYNIKLGGLHSPTTGRMVAQYNYDGKFLRVWDTITDAARSCELSPTTIIGVCREQGITAAGYVWKYYSGDVSDIVVKPRIPSNKGDVNSTPVVQYSKAGYRKRTFKSIAEASRHLNIDSVSISACCRNHNTNKSAGGYQWRYLSDDIDELEPLNSRTSSKSVEQLTEAGVVIGEFKSSNIAAKSIGIPKGGRSIRSACKTGNMYKGYYWKTKD